MTGAPIDWVLHLDTHLAALAASHGTLVYLVLFTVIFIETGVVVLPFLPGDSLLFVAGALSAQGSFRLPVLVPLLIGAAIAGDAMNYAAGSLLRTKAGDGHRIPLVKPEHLARTEGFFERHGRKTVVLARFVPVVRTLAPFVAALGRMPFGAFLAYNAIGGGAWVIALLGAGYAFGNLPWVGEHLTLVMLGIVALSVMPGLIGWLGERKDKHKEALPERDRAPAEAAPAYGKVPAVTLGFWLIKIAATTLGETAGDALTMSLDLGYLVGTLIFAAILLCALTLQIRAWRFHPMLFWTVIVATTTVGTTLADLCDRSLGIGYLGGTALLSALLAASLLAWHRTLGSVAVDRLDSRRAEIFYWVTILFSQTLGTALGDWVADPESGWGLGYQGGALLFAAGLAVVAAAYYRSRVSHTVLFWAAFVLTRPLGATVGDFLDKPVASGGLALDRFSASAALAGCMLVMILALPQRAERVRSSRA